MKTNNRDLVREIRQLKEKVAQLEEIRQELVNKNSDYYNREQQFIGGLKALHNSLVHERQDLVARQFRNQDRLNLVNRALKLDVNEQHDYTFAENTLKEVKE